MRIDFHGGSVVKRAENEDDRIRLSAEARALRACAHPGVVGLVALDGGADRAERLTLRRLTGITLVDAGVQPAAVVAGQGAAILTTLADLHELGWVHRAVEARHVLLDEDGRPVLCGFGRAERPLTSSDLAHLAALDVAATAALLRDRLPASADRRLHRLLARAAGERGRRRPPSARLLARRIVDIEANACLSPPEAAPPARSGATGLGSVAKDGPDGSAPADPAGEPAGTNRRPAAAASRRGVDGLPPGAPRGRSHWGRVVPRWRARTLVIGATAMAATAVVGTAVASGASHPSTSPTRPAPIPNLALRTTSDRFMMADPSGPMVTVIGAWGCGARRPAGLDLRTGWVWTFPAWPDPGSSVPGQPVGHVVGATGLAVQATSGGCDTLVVLGPGHRRLVISGRPAPDGRRQESR